jgi:hypothetical protein
MTGWDDLGFAVDYEVDAGIEYPGDGDWGIAEYTVPGRSAWETTAAAAIIRPASGDPWLLSTGMVHGAELYGAPEPWQLCVFGWQERAVLVDTRAPEERVELDGYPLSIARARDENLLLLADESSIWAADSRGIVWRHDHLFADELRIRRTDNGRIVCRGFDHSPTRTELTLDARTGNLIPD